MLPSLVDGQHHRGWDHAETALLCAYDSRPFHTYSSCRRYRRVDHHLLVGGTREALNVPSTEGDHPFHEVGARGCGLQRREIEGHVAQGGATHHGCRTREEE